MEKDVLAPGEKVDLEIFFSTKSYRGLQTKRPSITTNEPWPNSTKFVIIRANVVTQPDSTYPIVIRPHQFNIPQPGEYLSDQTAFSIENVSDEVVKIKIIDYPKEYIKIHLPRVIKPGETIQGYIDVKPQAVDKEFEKSITLEIKDSDATRFTIPVARRFTDSPIENATAGALPTCQ